MELILLLLKNLYQLTLAMRDLLTGQEYDC